MHHFQDEIKILLIIRWLKKETKVMSFGVVHIFKNIEWPSK